jgi:hypothetical protein
MERLDSKVGDTSNQLLSEGRINIGNTVLTAETRKQIHY